VYIICIFIDKTSQSTNKNKHSEKNIVEVFSVFPNIWGADNTILVDNLNISMYINYCVHDAQLVSKPLLFVLNLK